MAQKSRHQATPITAYKSQRRSSGNKNWKVSLITKLTEKAMISMVQLKAAGKLWKTIRNSKKKAAHFTLKPGYIRDSDPN